MDYKKKMSLLICVMSTLLALRAQDKHFADVQQMGQWYNQSLKTDRNNNFNFNFRNIRYQNLLAFKTGTALLNMPLGKKETRTVNNDKGFINMSFGASYDQSNTNIYKNTVGLLGLSYAQQLTADKMYMSVGFQGNFTHTSFNNNGTFPDQLDKFGPIAGRVSEDPLRGGRTYNYFSLNTGICLFKSNDNVDWYAGASVRDVNKPYTEETKSLSYRLAPTLGLQGGLKYKTATNIVDLYSVINWKARANEYLGGVRYNFIIQSNNDDVQDDQVAFGVGCAYRYKDAFIPSINLDFRRTRIGFYYDMNTSGIRSSGYTRNGFELSLTQKF